MKKGDSGPRVKVVRSQQSISGDLYDFGEEASWRQWPLRPDTVLARWKRLMNVIDR
ncbi:MAG TPA: hypothetical protein VMW69_14855 [Spirochaetia bacterium]|nr:hypothetical protein [Spirochaetia bacterium]